MTERKTGRRFTITYIVWCLELHGHSSNECGSEFGCPCVGVDPDTGDEIHDPDQFNHGDCDAGYEINDRSRCGEIEVEVEEVEYNTGSPQAFNAHPPEDAAIIQALIDAGLLKSHVTPDMFELADESEDSIYVESASDGEPLYQLEFEHDLLVI